MLACWCPVGIIFMFTFSVLACTKHKVQLKLIGMSLVLYQVMNTSIGQMSVQSWNCLQFILRGTWMGIPNLLAICPNHIAENITMHSTTVKYCRGDTCNHPHSDMALWSQPTHTSDISFNRPPPLHVLADFLSGLTVLKGPSLTLNILHKAYTHMHKQRHPHTQPQASAGYMALWQKTSINTTYVSTVNSESTDDWPAFCITACMWQSERIWIMIPSWPYLQSNCSSGAIYLPVFATLYGFMALDHVLASCYLMSVCFAFVLLYVAVVHEETSFLTVSIRDRKMISGTGKFSVLMLRSWKCLIE